VAMTTRSRGEAGGVFDADNANLLMGADHDHWWFRSKAALVATAIRRTGGRRSGGWLVDVGAGAGGVTAMLGWDPSRIVVVEGSAPLATSARRRHGLAAVQATVDHLPLAADSADVVCLLDVIEHLDDPGAALRQAVAALGADGRVIVNVPAHEWLWSEADTFLGHVRRYTRGALRDELAAAGLEPILITHVFSWLVPPVWVTRRASADRGPELGLDRASPTIDRAAMVLTGLERALVGRLALPFGTSVLCVAQRTVT
jgi:SAM-dependent methyltransferase